MRVARRLAMVLVVASSGMASAQVNEQEVLDAARALAAIADIDTERARAREAGAGLFPNPTIGFERQQTFAPNAQSQDLLTVDWPIPLGGRAVERALARVDTHREAALAAHQRRRVSVEALGLFYRALYLQRRAELLEEHANAMEEAARIVSAREAAGDAPGSETLRARLESSLTRSRAASAQNEAQSARSRLLAWLSLERSTLEGTFDVSAPPTLAELEAQAGRDRQELRALSMLQQTSGDARARGARLAWPELTLRGGYNRQAQPVGHGYAIGASLDIPLFDRRQGTRAEAAVLASRAELMLRAARAQIRAEVAEGHQALVGALSERERFASVNEPAELVRSVLAGYAQGEASLLEVIDARRVALEVALRRAELDHIVRQADVMLRAAVGSL